MCCVIGDLGGTYADFCELSYGFQDCDAVGWVGYFGCESCGETGEAGAYDYEMERHVEAG